MSYAAVALNLADPFKEVGEEATGVKHHKQKIAFLFAAMQYFAAGLKKKGIKSWQNH